MFGEQATRLLRKLWTDPNQLAQELFAMFQNDIPLSSNAPMTITNRTDGPALTLRNLGGGWPIEFRGQRDEPLGKITIENGKPVFQGVAKRAKQADQIPGSGAGGGGTLGKVVSGTGTSYVVAKFPNGSGGGTTGNVSAECPGVTAGETIPANTWVMLTHNANSTFSFIGEVWL